MIYYASTMAGTQFIISNSPGDLESQLQDLTEAHEATVSQLSQSQRQVTNLQQERGRSIQGSDRDGGESRHRLLDLEQENRTLRQKVEPVHSGFQ